MELTSLAVPRVERGLAPHAFLVDDDRRSQVLQGVDVGAGRGGHEALDEAGVGLVDEASRLRGDRGTARQRRCPGLLARLVLTQAVKECASVATSLARRRPTVIGTADTAYTCGVRTPKVLSDAVNDEDTWVSTLADAHAEATNREVQAIDDAFSELLSAIDAKKKEVGQYVDEE